MLVEMSMKIRFCLSGVVFGFVGCFSLALTAQQPVQVGPVFKDGQAQIVEEFKDRNEWLRHDLWVETEFDTDGDDKPDRMHVSVCRPKQTDDGLKVPVVYVTSPYFSGTSGTGKDFFWDPKHELGEE